MKRSVVIHPFLIGIYPVLFLYHYNMKAVPLSAIIMPLIVVTCFTLLSWFLLLFFVRAREKAGIILSVFLLFFFSYGRYYDATKGVEIGEVAIGSYKVSLTLWVTVIAVIVYKVLKTTRDLRGITTVLNIVSIFLVMVNIALGAYWFSQRTAPIKPYLPLSQKTVKRPDIYYIIVDAYARDDVLRQFYRYDNSGFLEYLNRKGFYIAKKSRSNYAFTDLSLASSLNFSYLDDLVKRLGEASDDRMPLHDMIRNSRVSLFLKNQGYKLVAFSSAFSITDIRNADTYIAPKWPLNDFVTALINTTPLMVLMGELQHNLHKGRILFTLDRLPEIAMMKSPKFVFAHVPAPHPPFVFGECWEDMPPSYLTDFSFDDGFFIMNRDRYIECYKRQLISINEKLKDAIEGIMANSAEPPVIIIAGDHGPRSMVDLQDPDNTTFKEAMSILLACRLPENERGLLYPEITPVNIFRIILDQYFSTDLRLLEDKSYFSTGKHPYQFIDVTKKIDSEPR